MSTTIAGCSDQTKGCQRVYDTIGSHVGRRFIRDGDQFLQLRLNENRLHAEMSRRQDLEAIVQWRDNGADRHRLDFRRINSFQSEKIIAQDCVLVRRSIPACSYPPGMDQISSFEYTENDIGIPDIDYEQHECSLPKPELRLPVLQVSKAPSRAGPIREETLAA